MRSRVPSPGPAPGTKPIHWRDETIFDKLRNRPETHPASSIKQRGSIMLVVIMAVTALLVVLSTGIFLAHAFDAYRAL
jgi:hypothetical protein